MNPVDSPVSRPSARPRRRTFQRFVAWIMVGVGALSVLLSLAVPSTANREEKEGETVILVFGAVVLAGGIAWLWTTGRRDSSSREQFEEREVLAVAARHGGRATIAQITLETPLSTDEAERVVNRLCGRNIAQPDVMDDGTVVYHFGVLSAR